MPISSAFAQPSSRAFGKCSLTVITPSILLNGEGITGGTTFIDSSPYARTVTPSGTITTSTVQSKWGNGSIATNGGANSGLTVASSPDFAFGTGDFCVEAWVRFNVLNIDYQGIVDTRSSIGQGGLMFAIGTTALYVTQGNGTLKSVAHNMAINTWYYVAVSRYSGYTRIYKDGISLFAYVDTSDYSNQEFRACRLVDRLNSNAYYNDIRVTKGNSRFNSQAYIPVPSGPLGPY